MVFEGEKALKVWRQTPTYISGAVTIFFS